MFAPDQYQLLDFGQGRKLEQFGGVLVDRPSPAAENAMPRKPALWRAAQGKYRRTATDRGVWDWQSPPPQPWNVAFDGISLTLKPTEFGHLGLFPEQAENWNWIDAQIRQAPGPLRVLNLFAYTGAATLAAARAGAEVTHVDSARTTVAWAWRNAELSALAAAPIRWIVEDAATFALREIKRCQRYQGVILDPPSYGHGPKGEVWKLEERLPDLLRTCAELSDGDHRFLVLSCHSPGFSPNRLGNLLTDTLGRGSLECEPMAISNPDGRRLPAGSVARWTQRLK